MCVRGLLFACILVGVKAQIEEAADYCVQDLSGFHYDLRPLFRTEAEGDWFGHDEQFAYKMNVCGPSHAGGKCEERNGTLCQYMRAGNKTGSFIAMIANTNEVPVYEMLDKNDAKKGVKLTWQDLGEPCKDTPRKAVMSFYCVDKQFPKPSFLIHEDPQSCVYEISVNSPDACPKAELPPPITPGKAYYRSVTNRSWDYLSVDVGEGVADLVVKLVQTGSNKSNFGDPDLYVRRGALPTTSTYDYSAVTNHDNETISIRKGNKDKPLTPGRYVVGVFDYSAKPVTYEITAYTYECPGDCSGHGTCTNGKCVCEGYTHDDCSASLTDIDLGAVVNGNFHNSHDTQAFYRFTVEDEEAYQLQVDIEWANTNLSGTVMIKKDEFPSYADNDAVDSTWYGDRSHMQLSLTEDKVSTGQWIVAVNKKKDNVYAPTPFTISANTYDCLGDCSGHGTCDKASHNCTCEPTFSKASDCSVEVKELTTKAPVTAKIEAREHLYFSLTVPEPPAGGRTDDLVVNLVCKNLTGTLRNFPQLFIQYGQHPDQQHYDAVTSLPPSSSSQLEISAHSLQTGQYFLYVPNWNRVDVSVAISMHFRTHGGGSGGSTGGGGSSPTPSSESGSAGHSTGTLVGFCILFLAVGLAAGWMVATRKAKGNRHHRMIEEGINSDGSYDPPLVDY